MYVDGQHVGPPGGARVVLSAAARIPLLTNGLLAVMIKQNDASVGGSYVAPVERQAVLKHTRVVDIDLTQDLDLVHPFRDVPTHTTFVVTGKDPGTIIDGLCEWLFFAFILSVVNGKFGRSFKHIFGKVQQMVSFVKRYGGVFYHAYGLLGRTLDTGDFVTHPLKQIGLMDDTAKYGHVRQ